MKIVLYHWSSSSCVSCSRYEWNWCSCIKPNKTLGLMI